MSNLDLEVSTLELNASPSKLELIKQELECDPQMLMLKELIIQGWPKDIKQCPSPLCSYWNYKDELSIVDGIVVKGNHIVLPLKAFDGQKSWRPLASFANSRLPKSKNVIQL